jgi:hypothetical protein
LRISFSTHTRWVIYLQNRVIDHIKYSILLGWGSSKGTGIIHQYGAPSKRSASRSTPRSPRYNPKAARAGCKQLQIIPIVLICRCGMWDSGSVADLFGRRRRAWTSPLRAVGSSGASYPTTSTKRGPTRQTLARPTRYPKRHPVDTSHRSALERPPRKICTTPNLPAPLSEMDRGMDRGRYSSCHTPSVGLRPRRAWGDRPLGMLHT